MHERSLLSDLIAKLEEIAAANPENRLAEVRVRLGDWAHMPPEHFREMAAGGARPGLPAHRQHVVLESVELE